MKGKVVYQRLLTYSRVYWLSFLLGVMGTMIAASMDASFAWMIKPLLDKGFIHKDSQFIGLLPVILMIVFLVRNGANFISNYYMSLAGRSIVTQFRKDLFCHYMKLPASYLDNSTSGQLLSKLVYNVEQVAKASTDAIVTVVQESCFIAGLMIVLFMNNWQLATVFIILAPLVALIARISSKKMRRLSQGVQQSMSSITQIAQESLEGYRVIRTFGTEAYEIQRFNQIADKTRNREMRTISTDALATVAVQFIIALMIAGTVYIATAKITHITAGTFVSMISAMLAMLKPMRNLTTVNNIIQKGIAGAESLFELLDEPPEPDQGKSVFPKTGLKYSITFDQVSFTYANADKPVLKNITFQVPAGKTLAIVGKSGSGKSTLISLLPRFYSHFSGDIKIDHINIQSLNLKALRSKIALVSQQIVLFNDSILNNIAYGVSGVDASTTVLESDIIEAAKMANAWEFIQEFPQKLHTIVGDKGVLLSGGQRQRIAIARALLKDAPILIFDEATSSLDTQSERYIQVALEKLIKNRTTLIIAHRLSTIEKSDQIIVMDSGRIIESGTHHELLSLNQHYFNLYNHNFE